MMICLGKRVRMMVLVCSVLFISEFACAEMARYEIDPEHTTIGFGAGHMMVSQVQGGSWYLTSLSRWIPKPRS